MLSNFNDASRFDEFMRFALYHPQHGYYSRGQGIFGKQGDFITAPELSPFFGQALGFGMRDMLPRCNGVVYEFGAGTGQLACDILHTAGDLISQYNIIEVSGGLKQTQMTKLAAAHGEAVLAKINWLNELPDTLHGIVLGNEVLDATPVRRFRWTSEGTMEAWVQHENNRLELLWKPADVAFAQTVEDLHTRCGPWPAGYESEVAEQSLAWVRTITERLHGVALMVDYGFHETLYYHPTRTRGTLRATSRHTAHDDFLIRVGEQDLTAHVNFSAVYEALTDSGGALEGYAHQGEFLIGLGILDIARQHTEFTHPSRGAAIRQNLNTLLNEADMGEAFKVMCWSKGIQPDHSLLQRVFLQHDRSGDL